MSGKTTLLKAMQGDLGTDRKAVRRLQDLRSRASALRRCAPVHLNLLRRVGQGESARRGLPTFRIATPLFLWSTALVICRKQGRASTTASGLRTKMRTNAEVCSRASRCWCSRTSRILRTVQNQTRCRKLWIWMITREMDIMSPSVPSLETRRKQWSLDPRGKGHRLARAAHRR